MQAALFGCVASGLIPRSHVGPPRFLGMKPVATMSAKVQKFVNREAIGQPLNDLRYNRGPIPQMLLETHSGLLEY